MKIDNITAVNDHQNDMYDDELIHGYIYSTEGDDTTGAYYCYILRYRASTHMIIWIVFVHSVCLCMCASLCPY